MRSDAELWDSEEALLRQGLRILGPRFLTFLTQFSESGAAGLGSGTRQFSNERQERLSKEWQVLRFLASFWILEHASDQASRIWYCSQHSILSHASAL